MSASVRPFLRIFAVETLYTKHVKDGRRHDGQKQNISFFLDDASKLGKGIMMIIIRIIVIQ